MVFLNVFSYGTYMNVKYTNTYVYLQVSKINIILSRYYLEIQIEITVFYRSARKMSTILIDLIFPIGN